jgi:hypothetical protein
MTTTKRAKFSKYPPAGSLSLQSPLDTRAIQILYRNLCAIAKSRRALENPSPNSLCPEVGEKKRPSFPEI